MPCSLVDTCRRFGGTSFRVRERSGVSEPSVHIHQPTHPRRLFSRSIIDASTIVYYYYYYIPSLLTGSEIQSKNSSCYILKR
jgi:hypothetical protein